MAYGLRLRVSVVAVVLCLTWIQAAAQEQLPFDFSKQERIATIGKNHYKLIGSVEIKDGETRFAADEVEIFTDQNRLVATGNVVFSSGVDRIAADRAEFHTKTRLGTFYNASGSASLKTPNEKSQFGTQEPDFYFYGEKIEKVGPDKYRITRGGFTTCLQPTPRWEITSSAVTLNLDDYALLRNAFLKVKNVPVLYMPVFYYPIQDDDRATGFLIPTYGTSTVRGQTISNAFFWAINRSHDATFFHDWFSKSGQSVGGEYRYALSSGSGTGRTNFLNEKARVIPSSFPGGAGQVVPGSRSYRLTGDAVQRLPLGLHARTRIDYFSNVRVQQTYYSNIFDASQRTRNISANVTGNWGSYSTSATYDRTDTFFGQTDRLLGGSTPRLSLTRAQRPVLNSPVYFTIGAEYVNLLRESRAGTRVSDQSLMRFDVRPLVRFPFTRWQFLTFNSSAAWRHTLYSERLTPDGRQQIDEALHRKYLDLQSDIVGPVFTRIWNTPGNFYAERFKHVIQPVYNLRRVTSIRNRGAIVPLEGGDQEPGGVTQIGYGLVNRFYAKRKEGSSTGPAREFLTVSVNQAYYSNDQASQFDPNFGTSFRCHASVQGCPNLQSKFSPVLFTTRASPTPELSSDFSLEFDSRFKAIRTIRANGTYLHRDRFDVRAGWSQQRFIRDLPGFDDRRRLAHSINGSANVRFERNRFGGGYSFNYDIQRSTLLQQQFLGYYNAQCCGVVLEYQVYNSSFWFGGSIPRDRRFNISFTLAGIGTFSNPFGALGGPGRR